MIPFLCIQWNPFYMFIYLHVCILVCWNIKLIHGMICGTVKKNVFKNKIVTGKRVVKSILVMPPLYSTSKRVLLLLFFFSTMKRQISLVLKVTAKMYLICFQAERQSRRQLTSSFPRQTCVSYRMDVIAFVMQRFYYREADWYKPYKPYGFFLDPFTHYHFVCYLHIYVKFI